jgi:hypothetical protein
MDAITKEDCVMKIMGQSHRKMSTCIVFLLACLICYAKTTSAQSTAQPSVCEYQETRTDIPINPKTNKPYTPEERYQEPFAEASINPDKIKQCLKDRQTITNHHIVFEDLVTAWKEAVTLEAQDLLRQKGITEPTAEQIEQEKTWDLPIQLHGGVLHAADSYKCDKETDRYVGSIDLWAFRHPRMLGDVSQLTEEQRNSWGITQNDTTLVYIHPKIAWEKVFIDAVVSTRREHSRFILTNEAHFSQTIFSDEVDVRNTTFNNKVDFSNTVMRSFSYFLGTVFHDNTDFSKARFLNQVDFMRSSFADQANFREALFDYQANFSSALFKRTADFIGNVFSNQANFSSALFESTADFNDTIFKDYANFRNMRVQETLTFNNTLWEGRVDLRSMRAKELHWDSQAHPSEIKGIFDLREATIGTATFNEIRFQDIVDLSRTKFHPDDKVDIMDFSKNILELVEVDFDPMTRLVTVPGHVLFTNNTFEKEADFLHVRFHGAVLLINNRFRSTLDLTGVMFEEHDAHIPSAHDTPPSLCLSYNRIHRLVLGREHLGSPPSVSPYDLLIAQPLGSLLADPLQTSRVRPVVGTEDAPQCAFADMTKSNAKNANRYSEHLKEIYKTIGQSFREANNPLGVNEALYLQKVVEQHQQSPIWYGLSRVFLDIPSRYTVDVWRTVWVSIIIMLVFYILYIVILFISVHSEGMQYHTVQVPAYSTPQRALRIRLFEPIRHTSIQRTRCIIPWWDAGALSFRAFTKIGLGTVYPNTRTLTVLTRIEWVLGVYMLIHFILAVKSNLPFIAPFLGVVN